MKHNYLFKTLSALALCAGMACADLASDLEDYRSQKAALEADLKKLDQRIQSTDSLSRDEARRSALLQERYAADLQRRKTELDSMQVKMQKQAGELQKERNLQSSAQLSSDNAKAYRKAIAQSLAGWAQLFENQVATTLPWDREDRVERIRALRRDLESGSATPEEGFSRLRSLYTEEIRFGDEVAFAERPLVRKNGETVNAKLLRIGNQWMVYHDDEALRFGVLERKKGKDGKQEFVWREDLSFEERQAVKLAIDVKLARKPPQMVSLPLSLSIAPQEVK